MDILPKKKGCSILYAPRNKTLALRFTSRRGSSKLIMIDLMTKEEAVKPIQNGPLGTLDSDYLEPIRHYTERIVEVLDRPFWTFSKPQL